ncbi:hypothetical protein BD311DRAFT_673028 [Dichomitus squalens]|uniref:Uncharacterized protein n=1 Tax=Dichomitus squalens TaxID=114155 RepID=A0A4Q9M9L8_9APHY|nr:hypothetical protein BD311DRAFT_673028 [Dichomitus squalens]
MGRVERKPSPHKSIPIPPGHSPRAQGGATLIKRIPKGISTGFPLHQTFADAIRRMMAANLVPMDNSDNPLEEEPPRQKQKGKHRQVMLPAEDDVQDEVEDEGEDNYGVQDEDEEGGSGAQGDDDDDDDGDQGDEELSARDARKFLKAIRNSKKKNKFHVSEADADPKQLTEHFKSWGRHCHRICGLYTDINNTIVVGMTVMRAAPHDSVDYESCYKSIPHMSTATAKFYTTKFFKLCDEIPKFTALCEQIVGSPEDVFLFAKYMQVHAAAGRTTDISTLKTSYHSYFPYVVTTKGVVIPPPGPGTLSHLKTRNGGYCSTSTGRLIVPVDELAQFDLDPSKYCKQKITQKRKIEAASIAVRRKKRHQADRPEHHDDNNSYPSFLFPTDLKYDSAQPDRHIFKSDFMVSGPSAVGRTGGARGLGRAPLVEIYKITKVTPDYLVYIAALLRYLLCTDERWCGDDRQRSGHRFHTALHQLLTVEYEAWTEDMEDGYLEQSEDELEWNIFTFFNEKVFGSEAGAPNQQDPDADIYQEDCDEEDNVRAQVLKARTAQLKARRAQRESSAPNSSPQHAEDARSRSSSAQIVDPTSDFVDIAGGTPPSSQELSGLYTEAVV